ncbi:hypothetical protein [Massilia sp. 9096]|uniref:hypothetical protein n=1 Tax=Massilia sp. 9096 TaxID=1500894 RepID=UPI0012E000AE|nr:hypothetical protein [Massilia sp. 9096]
MKKFILCAFIASLPILSSAQQALEEVATVVFRSKGDAMNVVFETSTSEQPCKGFSKVAGVYDANLLREKLLPFIARLQEKTRALMSIYPEVNTAVKSNIPLQVSGKAVWSDKSGNVRTWGKCGPFTQQFTPKVGHQYLVLFEFKGAECIQSISDVSDAEKTSVADLNPLECAK